MRMRENRNKCKRYTDEIKSHKFPWKYSNNFKYLYGKPVARVSESGVSGDKVQTSEKKNNNNNYRQMRRRQESIECRPMERWMKWVRERDRHELIKFLHLMVFGISTQLFFFLFFFKCSFLFNSIRFVGSFIHTRLIVWFDVDYKKRIFALRIQFSCTRTPM